MPKPNPKEIAALEARVAKLEKEAAEKRADEYMHRNGHRIHENQRATVRAMLVKNYSNAVKFVETLPAAPPTRTDRPFSRRVK